MNKFISLSWTPLLSRHFRALVGAGLREMIARMSERP